MEQTNDTSLLLELLAAPAFSVRNGIIELCNRQAQSLSILPGTAVSDLISIGVEEYAAMESGCLYLSLTVGEMPFGASVSRMSGYDLFLLESGSSQPELEAFGIASRELRGPLSDLKMISGILLPKLGEENREWAGAINHSIYKLMRIVNNMANAQSFAEDSQHRMEELQPGSVLRELLQQELTPLLSQVNISLVFTDRTDGLWCLIDEYKWNQAVYALISNAANFVQKDGTGTIQVTLKRSGERLVLTVTDNGAGIPPSIMGSVFARFHRSDMAEDSRHGIGLGLVLVRSVAVAHGGTVMIDQPPGWGTRVTMTIPIRRGKELDLSSRTPGIVIRSTSDGLVNLSNILPSQLYTPDQID